jgi:hypothetical protein
VPPWLWRIQAGAAEGVNLPDQGTFDLNGIVLLAEGP